MNDPKTCNHHDVYVTTLKSYSPQPSIGGKVFSAELICKECAARLKGQVQQQ